jgi:hypothetical protein
MRLKVVLTKGRRATEVGFSGVLSLGLFIPDDGGSTNL